MLLRDFNRRWVKWLLWEASSLQTDCLETLYDEMIGTTAFHDLDIFF